jgi:hypothetical protein
LSGTTLYHSGQTGDLLGVIRGLKAEAPIFLAGFSLGGNVVLKLAGELGENAKELFAGIAAVSPPMDLAASVKRLDRRSNFLYSRRFLRHLRQRIRVKEKLTPGLFQLSDLDRVKNIHDFDDRFTAPAFGFGTADNYYATQSSSQFLDRIRVPTLIIQAQDDPMVPFEIFQHPAFSRNPHLRLLAPKQGGHLGFLSKTKPRFWLDEVLLDWMEQVRNKAAAITV